MVSLRMVDSYDGTYYIEATISKSKRRAMQLVFIESEKGSVRKKTDYSVSVMSLLGERLNWSC